MPPATPPHLFIASLGNPGAAYALTRHSAGHIALSSLAAILGASFSPLAHLGRHPAALAYPSSGGEAHAQWLLFPSPVQMNASGPAVLKAYKAHLSATGLGPAACPLVVVHDALDRPAGSLALRWPAAGLSAKGHNGLKSLLDAFRRDQGMRGVEWGRVSVGIGRGGGEKGSRERGDVSAWVLGGVKGEELERLRGTGEGLRDLLFKVEGVV